MKSAFASVSFHDGGAKMARQWSDYRNTVYEYLRHYNHFKGQIANLDLEIQGIQDELKSLYDVNLTVKYGEHTAGGFNELSAMERVVVRKQTIEKKLPVLIADRQRIASLIQRIDNAMLSLGEMERSIIRMKFMERQRWLNISLETGYSERRCQDIANRSVNDITGILFPESMVGQQMLNFIFIEPGHAQENVGNPVDN